MNNIDDNNKTLNKDKPPTPLDKVIQSFAKIILLLFFPFIDVKIFFAKTLQFHQHTAFLMLKVLLMGVSFINPFLLDKLS